MSRIEKTNELQNEVIKSDCVKCNNKTNHKIISNYRIDDSEEIEQYGFEISWFDDYQILLCLGCDSVSFKHDSWFSEDWNPIDDGLKSIVYPERKLKAPLELNHVSTEIESLYKEVIDTYNIGAYSLTAVGIRGLIEGVCKAKGINNGNIPRENNGVIKFTRKNNLEGKIYGLLDNRYVSTKQVEILNELRWLGNSAVHEMSKPTGDQLDIALKIVESLLEIVFGFEKKAEVLKKFRER